MRSTLLATLVCAALCACRRDDPTPAPPLVRAEVLPDFARLQREEPDRDLPAWKRVRGSVLGDLRDAHVLAPGRDLLLPVPAGATRLATALAARRLSGSGGEEKARVDLEIADGS